VSYDELERAYNASEKRGTILGAALNAVVNATLEWTGHYVCSDVVSGEPGAYHFAVAGENQAHGGILIVSFSVAGQQTHTKAYYLEEHEHDIRISSSQSAYSQIVRRALSDYATDRARRNVVARKVAEQRLAEADLAEADRHA
jgi:hypothetical protein